MLQVVRLLLICLPLSSIAQQQPLQYTRLTAENGLSNNSVQSILQDKSGIVWIGTSAGLNRYDGSSFIPYSVLSSPALSNNVVTALMQDENGFIWIGTENGLNILQPATNTIQQFIHTDATPTSLPAGPIRVIKQMKDGATWILSDKWMIKFRDRFHFSPVTVDSVLVQNDMVFTAVALHQPGKIWNSYLDKPTTLAQLITKNGHDHLQGKLAQAPDYTKMFADSAAYTWGISCEGIKRFNNTTHHFENWLSNPYAPKSPNLHLHACYCLDADGNIWQGNERAGLVKYDRQTNKVTDYSWLLPANSATSAYCVYKDNSNNIWIGTDNGIIKISNRTSVFQNIPFALGNRELKNIRCRRILADKYNNFYAATENYGLLKMKPTRQGKDTTIALSTFGNTPISDLPWQNNQLRLKLTGRYDIGYMYDMWYDGNNKIWLAGYGISCYDINTDSLHIFLASGDEQARQESITQFAIVFDGKQFWTSGQHNLYTFDPHTQQLQPFRDNKGNSPFHQLPCWSLAKKDNWIWAGTSNGLYKIALIQTEKLFYEGGATAGIRTTTQYDYDVLGNVIRISDGGDGSQQDMVIANITYHDLDAPYIKSVPASIEHTTAEGVKRKRTTAIDNAGNAIKISQFLADGSSAVTDLEYDTYGNLTKITRPANYKAQRMWYSYEYDNRVHNYNTKITDAFGYTSSSTYDYRFGKLTSATSRNNEQKQYKIDNRGRLISYTGQYELAAGKPYTLSIEYNTKAAIPYATATYYDPEYNGDIYVVSFADGLGRTIQVKKQVALFKGKGVADDVLLAIVDDNTFDAFGRTDQTFFPITEPLGANMVNLNTATTDLESTITYDVLDRPVKKTLADGATTNTVYSITNGLFSALTTDALNNRTEIQSDTRNRKRNKKAYGPNGVITTSFEYDALNELKKVTDAKGNAFTITYDNLGRKTTVEHPDAGRTDLVYDLAGNLQKKITPQIRKEITNGGAIQYSYDYERLTDIDYPRQYQNKVRYTYGKAGTGNKAGRLILQEDASGG